MKKAPLTVFLFVFLVQQVTPAGFCAENNSSGLAPEGGSLAEEFVVGEQIHQSILSNFRPYTEPRAVSYIEKVGGSLASQAERKDLSYRFTILYNDRIYASSSPGGRVYITTGMIFFLDNESQLAAVLAHEIGELQYKNPKLSKMKRGVNKVTETGAMIAPAFGPFGALAALGLVGIHMLNNSSKKTPGARLLIADRKAMTYMVEAGYDPQGMVDVFYKFASAKSEIIPYFLDYYNSRPLTTERTEAMQKQFKKLPLQGKSFDVHRDQYLEMTKGIRDIYKTA